MIQLIFTMLVICVSVQATIPSTLVRVQPTIPSTLVRVPTNTGIVAPRPDINPNIIVRYPIINPGPSSISPVILRPPVLDTSNTIIKPNDKSSTILRNEISPEGLRALNEYRKAVLDKEMNSRILQRDAVVFGPNPNHDSDHWLKTEY